MVAYDGLWLCALTKEQHERTCGYWYTVTTRGSTPHTAFRTKVALLNWLDMLGLSVDGDIPDPGTHAVFQIKGSYRDAMHGNPVEFNALDGARVRKLSNGEYTLGVVTQDDDGLRSIHYLGPNVKERVIFDPLYSRQMEDAGVRDAVKYVVLNENTLGYIIGPNWVNVLAGSVIKGGHDWKNGPVFISPGVDRVRPATKADFEAFRVSYKGHLD